MGSSKKPQTYFIDDIGRVNISNFTNLPSGWRRLFTVFTGQVPVRVADDALYLK